jgi:hypothetical protein
MLQNAGAKVLIIFYPTKRSYKITACNLTIKTKTAFFSLQFDYYARNLCGSTLPQTVTHSGTEINPKPGREVLARAFDVHLL